MNLKEQTYICTLARCGTISKAAEELFLTAPALSMFLSNLEKNLGVQLFRRLGKTLQPTPIGQEYIRCASQMLLLKEQFDRKLDQEIGLRKQTVRIGIQQRRAISAMPWLVSRLKEELPNLNVIFWDGNYVELTKAYEQHQVDYLFYTKEGAVPGAEYVVLKEEPILVAVPEGHPCNCLAKQRTGMKYPYLDVADLEGETMILPKKDQSLRLAVDEILQEAGLHPSNIIEIGHFETIIGMVAEGLGIGFNRLGYLKDMPQPEEVQYYFIGEKPACSSLVLLYPKDRRPFPFHDQLVQIIQEYLNHS